MIKTFAQIAALPVLALGFAASAPAAQAQTLGVTVTINRPYGYAQPYGYGYAQPYAYGYRPYPAYQPPVVREQVDEYHYERHITREYAQ